MTKKKKKGFSQQFVTVTMVAAVLVPVATADIPMAQAASKTETFKVQFTESELQKGVKTVTIPDLVNVKDIKVNTGNVSFSQKGDQLTITVNGGKPSRTEFNPKKHSKENGVYTVYGKEADRLINNLADGDFKEELL